MIQLQWNNYNGTTQKKILLSYKGTKQLYVKTKRTYFNIKIKNSLCSQNNKNQALICSFFV